MKECMICGKPIGPWDGYATLILYDEDVEGNVEPVEWGDAYICDDCWEKIAKRRDEIRKVLEG